MNNSETNGNVTNDEARINDSSTVNAPEAAKEKSENSAAFIALTEDALKELIDNGHTFQDVATYLNAVRSKVLQYTAKPKQ